LGLKSYIKPFCVLSAKALKTRLKTCKILIEKHPQHSAETRERALNHFLVVGRKTANVLFLNTAFRQVAMAVDTPYFSLL